MSEIYCELTARSRTSALDSLLLIREAAHNAGNPTGERIADHLLEKLRHSTYLSKNEARWLKQRLISHSLPKPFELSKVEVEMPRLPRAKSIRQVGDLVKQDRVRAELEACAATNRAARDDACRGMPWPRPRDETSYADDLFI